MENFIDYIVIILQDVYGNSLPFRKILILLLYYYLFV